MSSDPTQASPTEGLRFDEPAPASGAPACARCQGPIEATYYEVNGHVVCAGCKSALQQTPEGSRGSRFIRAAAYGLGGAIAGAGIYYAILAITGYEIGLVAIAVGWLVGRGVQKGSQGVGGWAYQALAVGLTYMAIVSTYIPFIVKSMEEPAKSGVAATAPDASRTSAGADSAAVQPVAASSIDSSHASMTAGRFALGLLALLVIAAAAPFLAGLENILGLVIIGFALYQAWQMNRRARLTITGPYAVQSTNASTGQ